LRILTLVPAVGEHLGNRNYAAARRPLNATCHSLQALGRIAWRESTGS
jgi:hypothetical protein